MRYSVFETVNGGVIAIEDGSALEQEAFRDCSLHLGIVEARPVVGFSPASSAFQSHNTHEYINTGLDYPHQTAVVVH